MKVIARTSTVRSMSRRNKPVTAVEPWEKIALLTEDCYSGTVRNVRDRFPASLGHLANPATGPVYVRGAKPGDVLAVEVLDVAPVGRATMLTGPGKGPLGHRLGRDEVVKMAMKGGFVRLGKRRIRTRPMIGVIGVAPRGNPVPNTWPGEHGGNLDCNVIRKGAIVYLPVNVNGALLALGDVHAVQAAGEVAICAAECRARVTVQAGICRGRMMTPAVLFEGNLYIIASAKTLDRAQTAVIEKAYRFLTEVKGMNGHEAVRFMSLACDLEICQVVDPLKTLRVRIPAQ